MVIFWSFSKQIFEWQGHSSNIHFVTSCIQHFQFGSQFHYDLYIELFKYEQHCDIWLPLV